MHGGVKLETLEIFCLRRLSRTLLLGIIAVSVQRLEYAEHSSASFRYIVHVANDTLNLLIWIVNSVKALIFYKNLISYSAINGLGQ